MASYTKLVTLLVMTLPFIAATPTGGLAPLIVGGVEAQNGEFPWIVDIKRPSHYCAASLINAEWIVTAAHCAQGMASGYTVVAGDHDIDTVEGTEQTRKIVRIVNHPSYSPGTFENDIALMKVSQPFELNDRVRPAALPAINFTPTGSTTAAGWGRTIEGGAISSRLLKVDLPYINDAACNQAYDGRIKESMICAGWLGTGGKDACQGDSGGPLMCERGGQTYLCGIVSWGTGCARANYPGVYTETSYFIEWINSVVGSS